MAYINRRIKRFFRVHSEVNKRVYVKFKRKIYSNKKIKNIHINEDIYILCTGPSIKDINSTFFIDKICISVSHFYNHEECRIIKPQYHVLAPNHEPFTLEHYSKYIQGLDKWNWDFTCFFGYQPYKNSILTYILNNNIKFKYSFFDVDSCNDKKILNYKTKDSWDLSKKIPAASTVLIYAIHLAVYLGARRIFLLGCDHDYIQHFKSTSIPHFYKAEDGHDDSSHLNSIDTLRWFEILAGRWKHYIRIKNYCDRRNISIVNLTRNSSLDVFPFKDIENVYE